MDMNIRRVKMVGIASGFRRSLFISNPIERAIFGGTTNALSSKWSEQSLECWDGFHSWPGLKPWRFNLVTHSFLLWGSEGNRKNPLFSPWLLLQWAATQYTIVDAGEDRQMEDGGSPAVWPILRHAYGDCRSLPNDSLKYPPQGLHIP